MEEFWNILSNWVSFTDRRASGLILESVSFKEFFVVVWFFSCSKVFLVFVLFCFFFFLMKVKCIPWHFVICRTGDGVHGPSHYHASVCWSHELVSRCFSPQEPNLFYSFVSYSLSVFFIVSILFFPSTYFTSLDSWFWSIKST